jgi:hypothetical protein
VKRMKRLGRGCRVFEIQRALKEQFRQEALPIMPNSFQHRACMWRRI